jgi:putative hydrolase of the HAD superfamily
LWYQLPTIEYCLNVGISSWEALWAEFIGENINLKQLYNLADEYQFSAWNNALIRFNIHNLKLAGELRKKFKKIRNSKHKLYPETIEVLEQLKLFYQLGLITNGAPDIQWKKINGSMLKDYFDCIIISAEHGFGKPDTRLFQIAIEKLKSAGENTIMVGNSLDTDIKGAQNAGIRTIWINRENKVKAYEEIHPDFETDNLLKIIEILAENQTKL